MLPPRAQCGRGPRPVRPGRPLPAGACSAPARSQCRMSNGWRSPPGARPSPWGAISDEMSPRPESLLEEYQRVAWATPGQLRVVLAAALGGTRAPSAP